MIIYADLRNLQKDKHHCNTPPIWALWRCGQTQSSPQWRHIKTHLEFAEKRLKDPQTVRNKILWSDEPQFQASCLKETSSAHLLQSTNPKVKCACSSLMLWGCFSAAGTEGLIRVEEKLNAPKYWDSLMKTQSRAFRTSDWAEGSPSNRTMNLNTQQEWLKGNSVSVLEWPSHSLGLNPVKYFWRNLKMCICPHPTWQSLRGEEVRRRLADNCQNLMRKACHIKPKKTWDCKGASAKYLVNGMNTYAMYLFQFFIFNKFTKLWQFCFCFVNMVYGV